MIIALLLVLGGTFKVLEESGYLIKVIDVVGVKIGDEPGKLTSALDVLDKAHINMEYLYAFMARNMMRLERLFNQAKQAIED